MCAAKNAGNAEIGRSPRRGAAPIPAFSLYGETAEAPADDFVHIEDIASRSQRYDWEIDRHVHHGLVQMLAVFAGGVEIRLDDVEASPPAPCLVLVPAGTVHAFRFRPGTVGRVLTFTEAHFAHGRAEPAALLASLFAAPAIVDLAGAEAATARLARLLDDIDGEFHAGAPGRSLMLEAQVVAVAVTVARCHASTRRAEAATRPEVALAARFRALVDRDFAEHRPVGAYAAELGVTESRLDRAMRAVGGRSAFETIQDRLLLEARRKLIYIAAPVSKLAYELGFEDPAYFWRFFRRRTGMTPTEFRRAERRGADGGEPRAAPPPRPSGDPVTPSPRKGSPT